MKLNLQEHLVRLQSSHTRNTVWGHWKMWCVFISLHFLGTSNEHLLKFPVGKEQCGTFLQEMLVLYDLPHQRKANSFRNFHQKNVTYAESLRNLHIQIPRSWDALSLCLQGKNQSLTFRIELLLCYPLATLLSHPQLFHTKDLAK